METNLSLRGRVQIYNNDTGECVLDKHNAITDLGKQRILLNLFRGNNSTVYYTGDTGPMSITSFIKFIGFGYDNVNPTIDRYWSNNTYLKKGTGDNYGGLNTGVTEATVNAFFLNIVQTSTFTPILGNRYGDITASLTKTGTEYKNEKKNITFTDDGNSVTVVGGNNAYITGGTYMDSTNNTCVVYVKLKYMTTDDSHQLTAISLFGSESVSKESVTLAPYYIDGSTTAGSTIITNINGSAADDADKFNHTLIPWTYLTFNLGALAYNSVYVIKYTLYM